MLPHMQDHLRQPRAERSAGPGPAFDGRAQLAGQAVGSSHPRHQGTLRSGRSLPCTVRSHTHPGCAGDIAGGCASGSLPGDLLWGHGASAAAARVGASHARERSASPCCCLTCQLSKQTSPCQDTLPKKPAAGWRCVNVQMPFADLRPAIWQELGVHNFHTYTGRQRVRFDADNLLAWARPSQALPAQDIPGMEWVFLDTFDIDFRCGPRAPDACAGQPASLLRCRSAAAAAAVRTARSAGCMPAKCAALPANVAHPATVPQ